MIILQKLFESAGGSPTPVVEMHKTKSPTVSSLKSASAIGAKVGFKITGPILLLLYLWPRLFLEQLQYLFGIALSCSCDVI